MTYPHLRSHADRVKSILEETAIAERVRDDWGEESFAVRLKTDSERANTAGLTNYDVAMASQSAMAGHQVTQLREGDKQIPVSRKSCRSAIAWRSAPRKKIRSRVSRNW